MASFHSAAALLEPAVASFEESLAQDLDDARREFPFMLVDHSDGAIAASRVCADRKPYGCEMGLQ